VFERPLCCINRFVSAHPMDIIDKCGSQRGEIGRAIVLPEESLLQQMTDTVLPFGSRPLGHQQMSFGRWQAGVKPQLMTRASNSRKRCICKPKHKQLTFRSRCDRVKKRQSQEVKRPPLTNACVLGPTLRSLFLASVCRMVSTRSPRSATLFRIAVVTSRVSSASCISIGHVQERRLVSSWRSTPLLYFGCNSFRKQQKVKVKMQNQKTETNKHAFSAIHTNLLSSPCSKSKQQASKQSGKPFDRIVIEDDRALCFRCGGWRICFAFLAEWWGK